MAKRREIIKNWDSKNSTKYHVPGPLFNTKYYKNLLVVIDNFESDDESYYGDEDSEWGFSDSDDDWAESETETDTEEANPSSSKLFGLVVQFLGHLRFAAYCLSQFKRHLLLYYQPASTKGWYTF